MRLATITLAVLLLSGCAGHLEIARPPADKLECPDEPGRPGTPGQPVTDEQAGRYMGDLRETGQACRDDVNWLRNWFKNLPE